MESKVKYSFSDHFIPSIAGQREEMIVKFKNEVAREAGNEDTNRTYAECFREALLALSQRFLGLLTPAEVVDDELRELPTFPVETHGADLHRYDSAVNAPKRHLDLALRQIGQIIAVLLRVFGRKEIAEVPSDHLLQRDAEHPLQRLVGQMNRPIDAGDQHAVRRDFGEQPVALFAIAPLLLDILAL